MDATHHRRSINSAGGSKETFRNVPPTRRKLASFLLCSGGGFMVFLVIRVCRAFGHDVHIGYKTTNAMTDMQGDAPLAASVAKLLAPTTVGICCIVWRPLKNLHYFLAGFPWKQSRMFDFFSVFPAGPPVPSHAVLMITFTHIYYAVFEEMFYRSLIYHSILSVFSFDDFPYLTKLVASASSVGLAWRFLGTITSLYLNIVYHAVYLWDDSLLASSAVRLSHDIAMSLTYLFMVSQGQLYTTEDEDVQSLTHFEGAFVYPRDRCLWWRGKLVKFWKRMSMYKVAIYIEDKIPKPPISPGRRYESQPISLSDAMATTLGFILSTILVLPECFAIGTILPVSVSSFLTGLRVELFYLIKEYFGKWGVTILSASLGFIAFLKVGTLMESRRLDDPS